MDEVNVIETLKEFVSGNTLVMLYVAYSITKYVLIPIYKGGGVIRNFFDAATGAMQASREGHLLIATELKALNETLKSKK